MQGGHKNTYDSIAAFSATDFREDLKKIDVPTLVIHGDDDQIVPIDLSGRASAALVKGAELIVYEGGPHGITDTHKARLNQDLLDFLSKCSVAPDRPAPAGRRNSAAGFFRSTGRPSPASGGGSKAPPSTPPPLAGEAGRGHRDPP